VSDRTITLRRRTQSGPAARVAVPVAIALVPAACGGDDPREAIHPIGDLYNLVPYDGVDPSAVTEDGGDTVPTTELIAGLLVPSFNETFTLAADYRVTDGVETSFFGWDVAGDRVTLSFEGATWVLER